MDDFAVFCLFRIPQSKPLDRVIFPSFSLFLSFFSFFSFLFFSFLFFFFPPFFFIYFFILHFIEYISRFTSGVLS